ncbi:MAG TPA: copper oxidase [Symbiobacteriaceae bacterium]|jgi:FtsP/CotA-like multicopper oxidase with cupredoxin domain
MRNKWIPASVAALTLLAVAVSGCSTATKATDTGHNAAPAAASGAITWQDMDKMHEAGIKAFPAETAGKGNQTLQPDMDGDVKVFHLTVSKIQWEVAPGKKVDAYAYNGQVPGPAIHVTEGDKVRVIVKNDLPESTAVHWHGLLVSNDQDGVPYLTQPPITPGSTYTYNWVAVNPGTQMYHSHHNSTAQVTKGLYGALIVDPKEKAERTKYKETVDATMFLSDGNLGFTLNGKEFPATSPISAKRGDKVRIRYINAGQLVHTMHLHGLTQLVVEKDGYSLPQPYKADTILIGPGERYDVIVDANNPGAWALHCHVLGHAESEHGMFGMVTALIVAK